MFCCSSKFTSDDRGLTVVGVTPETMLSVRSIDSSDSTECKECKIRSYTLLLINRCDKRTAFVIMIIVTMISGSQNPLKVEGCFFLLLKIDHGHADYHT